MCQRQNVCKPQVPIVADLSSVDILTHGMLSAQSSGRPHVRVRLAHCGMPMAHAVTVSMDYRVHPARRSMTAVVGLT